MKEQIEMADKSYANFGLTRSVQQARKALKDRKYADSNKEALLEWVQLDESRMEEAMGRPIRNMRILEVGPGQDMERALYFGRYNRVEGLDYDVIPRGFEPLNYVKMVKENGLGRLAKTVGRKVIMGNSSRDAWARAMGVSQLNYPSYMHGDICTDVPDPGGYDIVMTWSVFEHVADPRAALQNVIDSLKPGGVLYISLHLWTCNNGHHDMRSFTGSGDEIPLFAHLRPNTKHLLVDSCYLNEWRIPQWREIFNELAPGHTEYLEKYEHEDVYKPQLTPAMWDELSDYTEDELFTCNLVYRWKKPTKSITA